MPLEFCHFGYVGAVEAPIITVKASFHSALKVIGK